MNKSLEILKKYSNVMDMEDYLLIKRELKILNSYREHTLLTSECYEANIKGKFFIHDDCEDFEYFMKNEYLEREK